MGLSRITIVSPDKTYKMKIAVLRKAQIASCMLETIDLLKKIMLL